MLKQMQFNGEVVVVTGAGPGSAARPPKRWPSLARPSVLVGRTQDKLDEVKAALEKSGAKARLSRPTCRRRRTSDARANSSRRKWGRAKAVVNNAGNNFISPITELSTEKWHELIAVDLDSIFFMCRRSSRCC